jgi:hypothetical protein
VDAAASFQRIGGFVTSLPTSSVDPANTSAVYTFLRGGDGALYMTRLSGGVSSAYVREGGYLTSAPFTVTDTAGVVNGQPAVYTFLRGGDNALYVGRIVNGVWQGFQRLGGVLTAFPTATVTASGVWVAVRGADLGIYVNHLSTTGSWSGFSPLGGATLNPPWAASDGNVYVWGTDSLLYAHSLSGGSWSGPFSPISTSLPTATPAATGTSVFYRTGTGTLGSLHFVGLTPDRPEEHLGGYLTSAPWSVSAPGGLMSVYVRGGDGGLYRRHFNGSTWGGWESLGGYLYGVGANNTAPACCPSSVTDGANVEHTFVIGGDQALYTIAVGANVASLSTEPGSQGDAPPRGDGAGSIDENGIISSG